MWRGGAKASDLLRKSKSGFKLHPTLEAYYVQKLESLELDEKVKNKAYATGDFAGKTPVFSGSDFPTYGWCSISLNNGLSIKQWHTLDGEHFSKALELQFTKVKGWSMGSSPVDPKEESPEKP